MIVGLDFDNTIVCYDDVFYRAALAQGIVPAGIGRDKESVRDYLRQDGREDDWTRLQGHVYGEGILAAQPFPGLPAFLESCVASGHQLFVVSHKTRTPVLGPAHDLHAAATRWLEANGLFETDRTGLSPAKVSFELTKAAKLARIAALGCDYFVDDLPEFLLEPDFPDAVTRILFRPTGAVPDGWAFPVARGWSEVQAIIPAGRARTHA